MRRSAVCTAWILACGCAARGPEGELQAAIDGIWEDEPGVPGVVLTVRGADVAFDGAAGDTAMSGGRTLREDDLFRAASVTKTFVAAAALVLVEDGTLSLDAPIDGLLTAGTVAQLEGGGYDPSRITLRHLLTHTAGIYDYTEAASFYETILDDPSHRWTRSEQVQLAMDEGEKLNAPGAAYHYGDTHYILAGEVLEQATGRSLAETLRTTLRYDELGLTDTFLESLETPPSTDASARLTHPYIGDTDTRDWDPSWDLYGGGGIVTSTGDLVRFFGAIFEEDLFADKETLDVFTDMPEVGRGEFYGMDGGMGINRFDWDGADCFTGVGYFTTWVVTCPALDLTFAATENQAEPRESDRVVIEVIEIAG
jgi:D-alanyl-D-alanine carboxypeptidase